MDFAKLLGLKEDVLDFSRSQLTELIFPGGLPVACVEGKHIAAHTEAWDYMDKDLFVCAEVALEALASVTREVERFLSLRDIVNAAAGRYRKLRFENEGEEDDDDDDDDGNGDMRKTLRKGRSPKTADEKEDIKTFVPLSLLLGMVLSMTHLVDIPKRLRLSTFVCNMLPRALEPYPSVAKPVEQVRHLDGIFGRNTFAEFGLTPEEFEATQKDKYRDCYRRMRGLIPPNITRTTLKQMRKEGVPRKIAERIWEKKILWLICMHEHDLPKVHIADLRSKYQFHGLDIFEMRALWEVLPDWDGDSDKALWRESFRAKLDDLVALEIRGEIDAEDMRNSAYDGHDQLMIYDWQKELAPVVRENNVEKTPESLQILRYGSLDSDGWSQKRHSSNMILSRRNSLRDSFRSASRRGSMESMISSDGGHSAWMSRKTTVTARSLFNDESVDDLLGEDDDEDDAFKDVESVSEADEYISDIENFNGNEGGDNGMDDRGRESLSPDAITNFIRGNLASGAVPRKKVEKLEYNPERSRRKSHHRADMGPKTEAELEAEFEQEFEQEWAVRAHASPTGKEANGQTLQRKPSASVGLSGPLGGGLNTALQSQVNPLSPLKADQQAAVPAAADVGVHELYPARNNQDGSQFQTESLTFPSAEFGFEKALRVSDSLVDAMSGIGDKGTSRSSSNATAPSRQREMSIFDVKSWFTGTAGGKEKARTASHEFIDDASDYASDFGDANDTDSEAAAAEEDEEDEEANEEAELRGLRRDNGSFDYGYGAYDHSVIGASTDTPKTPQSDCMDFRDSIGGNDSRSALLTSSRLGIDELDWDREGDGEGTLQPIVPLNKYPSWSEFWAKFNQDRMMTQAEIETEKKIEHEIDNFIVPDELTARLTGTAADFADAAEPSSSSTDPPRHQMNGMSAATEVPLMPVPSETPKVRSRSQTTNMDDFASDSDDDSTDDSAGLGGGMYADAYSDPLPHPRINGQPNIADNTAHASVVPGPGEKAMAHKPTASVHFAVASDGEESEKDPSFIASVASVGVASPLSSEKARTLKGIFSEVSELEHHEGEADDRYRSRIDNHTQGGADPDAHARQSPRDSEYASPRSPGPGPSTLGGDGPPPVRSRGHTNSDEMSSIYDTTIDVDDIMVHGYARIVRHMVEQGKASVTPEKATELLLKCLGVVDDLPEPLETFILLVDTLGADVNSRDGEGQSPLQCLFTKPILGRFILSRGGDILAKDESDESVLQMCLEYDYDWIVPAFGSTPHEAALLEDRARAGEYVRTLLRFGGYGGKVRELLADGLAVSIGTDEALEIMGEWQERGFDAAKQPVETFELLEELVLADHPADGAEPAKMKDA